MSQTDFSLEQPIRDALDQLMIPSLDLSFANVLKRVEKVGDSYRLFFELPFFFEPLEAEYRELVDECIEQSVEGASWNMQFSTLIQQREATNGVKPLNGVKHVIAVASGKGGVGKSSTAVNLALALKDLGAKVGILDGDIYGPNLALMLGVPEDLRPEIEEQKYFVPLDAQGLQSMSMSYVTTENTPMVWRGPKASGAFTQLLTSTLWRELDYLLIDMPPGTGDIQLTMGQSVPVNGALIVTTPQNMATQDAKKGIEMFNKVNIPVLGLVENMSTHICSACGHEEAIFGQGGGELLADAYNSPFLGAVPLDATIREDCDSGFPTVAKDPIGDLAQRYQEIALRLSVQLLKRGETTNSIDVRGA